MPKADRFSTTTAAPSTKSRQPSILDLGHQLAGIGKEIIRQSDLLAVHQADRKASKQAANAVALLEERESSLHHVVCTIPAVTLADAAVQVSVAVLLAEDIAANELTADAVTRAAEKLERVLLSVLPVIAAAAGLNTSAMDWDQFAGLRADRFGGMEAGA